MKKKHTSMVTLGITSLFLIFAVLCMVILSLLTLGSARSDLHMSRRSMEQTTAYYDACSTATDFFLQAEDILRTAYQESEGEKEYFRKVSELGAQGFLWAEDTKRLSVEVSFSDTQVLRGEAIVFYPGGPEGPFLELKAWQTYSTGTWNPDTKQPVFTKEITQ